MSAYETRPHETTLHTHLGVKLIRHISTNTTGKEIHPAKDGGDGGEWRQYVPLVTSGLVLVDMLAGAVTGNSVANSITRGMQQSVLDKEAADEEAALDATTVFKQR